MADPFSILAGTVGLIDVCTRLAIYLKDIQKASENVDAAITTLVEDLYIIGSVTQHIKEAYEDYKDCKDEDENTSQDYARQLWTTVKRALQGCQNTLDKLWVLIEEIKGKEKEKTLSPRLKGFMKQLRKQSRQEEYDQYRSDLTNSVSALQVTLNLIGLFKGDRLLDSIRGLDSKIEQLRPQLQTIPQGDSLRREIESTLTVVSSSANKFFDPPQTVSSMFTGRKEQLKQLETCFFGAQLDQQGVQKRFVIYGMGGSGKTQFCCKFAQDNRRRFWGVFWIDGSSRARAAQTMSRIAKRFGHREPNERAGKDWLSSLKAPWLLIIDNLDIEGSEANIETLFPKGEGGYIIITTRTQSHEVHGTVGTLDFGELDHGNATDLLLKAAGRKKPWDVPTKKDALSITEILGFLPLAIIYAGKAIRDGLCTLKGYKSFYETSWQTMGLGLDGKSLYAAVYRTFEIMYLSLKDRYLSVRRQPQEGDKETARDAFELLNLFAFLNNESITVDLLIRAAKGPYSERVHQATNIPGDNSASKPRLWFKILKDIRLAVYLLFYQDRGPPVLPDVLRDSDRRPFDEARLRRALSQLSRTSFITRNYDKDSYSMHPLVHTWVRERPEVTRLQSSLKIEDNVEGITEEMQIIEVTPPMRLARKALWCQAAVTTLAQSILLTPMTDEVANENFLREILPHVDCVLTFQSAVRKQVEDNQQAAPWWRPLGSAKPTVTRGNALQQAKFSRVYLQCGLYNKAEKLQLEVRDFIVNLAGDEYLPSIQINLALSATYWLQGRGNDAAQLQEKVLQNCVNAFGTTNRLTLKTMDSLAVSYWQFGRYKEASALLETMIRRSTQILGPDHEDTLRATDHLGQVKFKYERFEEAKDLHFKAMKGMENCEALGPSHFDTLVAKDNLGTTYLVLGKEFLGQAKDLLTQVVEQRRARLGKEHPFTLLAIVNLARIKARCGEVLEAEKDFRAAIVVAERNLGQDHIGVLYGRARLGQLLVTCGRYEEAEGILGDVIEKHKTMASSRNSEHPDRLLALFYLLHCHRIQNRFDRAIEICDEIIHGLDSLGGGDHVWMAQLRRLRDAMVHDPECVDGNIAGDWTVR